MKKMDSIENTALIGALLRVRNIEDLQKIKLAQEPFGEKSFQVETVADYPGGLNSLRQEVADLLYVDGVYSEEKTVKTDVAFIVERDGSISNVHAQETISPSTDRLKLPSILLLKSFLRQPSKEIPPYTGSDFL